MNGPQIFDEFIGHRVVRHIEAYHAKVSENADGS
jgi:hypothetical protein